MGVKGTDETQSSHAEHDDLVLAQHKTLDERFPTNSDGSEESEKRADDKAELFQHMMQLFFDFEREARV